MSIEVEKLSIIDKNTYLAIGEILLSKGAKDLGENNTRTVFFHPEDARVKVQENMSKGTAKVVWKSGGSLKANDSRTEIELPFSPSDFDIAVDLVKAFLSGVEFFSARVQERHDYKLGDVNVSVKYSEDYGYHVECDLNVSSDDQVDDGLRKIEQVAQGLGLHTLSSDEENDFMKKMELRAAKKRQD